MTNNQVVYKSTLEFAQEMDNKDPLASFRKRFHIPVMSDGQDHVYLCGNSLGLQPLSVKGAIQQELDDWGKLGVEGHFEAKNPWMPYHEFLTANMAEVVGAKSEEVIVMNTLSVNLHLMMVTFYNPTEKRKKILIESDAFPSDLYAVESQIRFHGYDPEEDLLQLTPRPGEHCIRANDIKKVVEDHGDEIALILLGNTNYYTGQFFDMKEITSWGHAHGCIVGFDCAHGAGNIPLELHDSGADFAIWCTYKYLNSGPGSIGGCFIHERHHNDKDLHRFAGWWGHNKATRFGMRDAFDPIPTAEGWQLSNPPILSLAAIKASLDIFKDAGIHNLREKSIVLTGYMEYLLEAIEDERISIITPNEPQNRGAQLSIQVKNTDKTLFERITKQGVIADWRNPNVIRVAAVPLYNSFVDVYRFVTILKQALQDIE